MSPENQNVSPVEPQLSAAPVPTPTGVGPLPAAGAALPPVSVPQPPIYRVSLLSQSYLLLASLLVYIVVLGCLGLSYLTENYSVANNAAQATFWGGLIGAGLLGAGLVQVTLNSVNHHSGQVSVITRLGIILSMLAIVATPIILIPGIILLLIGLSRPATSVKSPMSPVKKVLLAVGVFLGGGVSGLLISLVIYITTSTRACELTSSKCF